MNADIIIVGGGIAGLRCGIELLHKRPSTNVVILEKYGYIGGRVVSYSKEIEGVKGHCKKVTWENGAGRISTSHSKVISLFKKYNLKTYPIKPDTAFEEAGVLHSNIFEPILHTLIPQIQKLPSQALAEHTLRELFVSVMGEEKANRFLIEFPYRGEVDVLRADVGLQSFQHEMGTYDNFVVAADGLSALMKHMRDEFEGLGGHIFLKHSVVSVTQEGKDVLVKAETPDGDVLWTAPTVILALHRNAFAEIPQFKSWNTLKYLRMEPLLRTYAVFPTEKGTSWFSDMPKIITGRSVRYFIPINPSCGTVMISYTDGKDAHKLIKMLDEKGEEALGKYILQEVRAMFPDKDIPEMLFFKSHPWYDGCTYWLPGDYDPKQESEKALHPFPKEMPGVYCCGESFSLRQAWMEGALEHADLLLNKYFNN